jgi:hypothetical protein
VARVPRFSPAWFAAVSGETFKCETVQEDFADWLDGFSYRARMAQL